MAIELVILFILFIVIALVLGRYLFKVFSKSQVIGDKVFSTIERFIFKLCKIELQDMNWKQYGLSMLITNMIMALVSFIILMAQNIVEPISFATVFNTIISFTTNTNFQTYSGETNLTIVSQMLVIIFLMFISTATGICVAIAFIRGISNKPLGNFYEDFVKCLIRILLPIAFVFAIVLISQGVIQTFKGNEVITTLEGTSQTIYRGPVAALEAIKQFGTNGGGFFGRNSAYPFENPTALTNILEMLAMMSIPGAMVVAFGYFLKDKKQAFCIFMVMTVLFLMSAVLMYAFESKCSGVLINGSNIIGNMEGKEVRFGIGGTTNFTAITTAFSTGALNGALDTMAPLTVLIAMWNMMLNTVFGGSGVGFMNMVMYAIITVFIAGLMVGRTPEFLGKKIEGKEIKLISLAMLIHPIIILTPIAITAVLKSTGTAGEFSKILYAFTSAGANNGSSYFTLNVATVFWSISTAIVMFIGRYGSMFLLLAVADSIKNKRLIPESMGTFKTNNVTFGILLFFIVIIFGALTFLPAVVLGPITQYLSIL